MTINKFDLHSVLANINKLKPYRFMKYHTLQLVLVKLNDFLSKKLMEATHFDNLFTKQPIEVTHFNNMFNEKPIGTNHFSNMLKLKN
jgi:hypothetical protein